MHLVLDARCRFGMNGCHEVLDCILNIVRVCDLHLRHVHVQEFHNNEASGPGISGVALLSDSHLNIHTWPEHRLVQVCLHSCNGFSIEQVKRQVDVTFGVDEFLNEQQIDRPIVEVTSGS